jgi:hypothetical protein
VIFKRKPLHERLAEEGGLVESPGDDTPVQIPRTLWDVVQGPGPNKASMHGVHRQREWDEVKTVQADVQGEAARFVVLPNDDIVIEDGPDDVEPLADALTLEPPYLVESVRRGEGVWAVAARRIELVELPGVDGSELQLTRHGEDRTLVVDGERRFGSIPALERPGNFTVSARRLDGDLWQIEASLL